MIATRYRDPSRDYASEARDDYEAPMPTPEHVCKGWLCFMLTTDLENAGWKNGLCPECQDELERERIREEQSERRYEREEIAREEAADSRMRDDKAFRDEP